MKRGISDNYKDTLYDYKVKKFLGIPIFEKKIEKNNIKKITFFKIPIYKSEQVKNFYIKTFFWGLIKEKTNIFVKIFYVFGKKIFEFKQNNNISLEQIENIHVQNLALATHGYLKKYKDIYVGKDIFILACGSTLNYFNVVKDNSVYIGVNRAYKQKNIKLDYLFVQDQFPEGMRELDNYIGNNCKKFYGILSNCHRIKFLHCKRIPHNITNRQNVFMYYLESIVSHNWPYDISLEPFGEFKSTVFSALQFALYTNPKHIYLVGCDCDTYGYFYGDDKLHTYPHLIPQWYKAKEHIDEVYPKIEVISINPVNLKGLFKDVYTENYLKDHPEIKNVEILKEQ